MFPLWFAIAINFFFVQLLIVKIYISFTIVIKLLLT